SANCSTYEEKLDSRMNRPNCPSGRPVYRGNQSLTMSALVFTPASPTAIGVCKGGYDERPGRARNGGNGTTLAPTRRSQQTSRGDSAPTRSLAHVRRVGSYARRRGGCPARPRY